MGWRLDDNEVAIIDEVGPCPDGVFGPALQLPLPAPWCNQLHNLLFEDLHAVAAEVGFNEQVNPSGHNHVDFVYPCHGDPS